MTRKIALVTGASRGFGFAVAEALAARGWHVIAVARTVGGLEDLDDRINEAGGTATLVPLDITDETAIQQMSLSIFERWGHIDLFVHCAITVAPLSPAGHVPEGDWDKMLATNIRATQRMITMLEPLLKAADAGAAVLPLDGHNVIGSSFMAAYGASKAAQQAIWNSWASETVTIGPKVMCFAPNPMPTALRARFYPGEDRSPLSAPRNEADRLVATLADARQNNSQGTT